MKAGAGAAAFNAPAPAPLADKPAADLLFTLSASKAVFTAANRLVLEGLQVTAQAFNTRTSASSIYALGALVGRVLAAWYISTVTFCQTQGCAAPWNYR